MPAGTLGGRIMPRAASPLRDSTLMTSAPRSAMTAAAHGAAIQVLTSTTLTPASGATMASPVRLSVRLQCRPR